MNLSAKAKQVLEVMAEEYEKNPETHLKGISKRVVGAKAGIYLNFPIYEIAELETDQIQNGLNWGLSKGV